MKCGNNVSNRSVVLSLVTIMLSIGVVLAVPPGEKADEAAPPFAVKTHDGKHLKLADFHGKYTLLHFWATWCTPCVASTPALKKMEAEWSKDERFRMISFSLDGNDDKFRAHIKKHGLDWPQVRLGRYSQIAADYRVTGVPAYVLVGPDGKIIKRSHQGSEIRKALKKALGDVRPARTGASASKGTEFARLPASQPSGKFEVIGTVIDEAGIPVEGALVSLPPGIGNNQTTDTNGNYRILFDPKWIRPGMTSFVFVRHHDRGLASVFAVSDLRLPATVKLIKGVRVTGRVSAEDGAPIVNALAGLRWSAKKSPWWAGVGEKATTDANGVFVFPSLPAGTKYKLSFSPDGYGWKQGIEISTPNKPGQSMRVPDIKLPRANQSVTGIVLGPDNRPVAGIGVGAGGYSQPSRSATTDKDGRFRIDGVCDDKIRIEVFDETLGLHGEDETRPDASEFELFLRHTMPRCVNPGEIASMINRQLPSFDRVGVDLNANDLRNKRILVCIWGMRDRVWRDCMRQLAARQDELASKGIAIIGIQTDPYNEEHHRKWIKRNGIRFIAKQAPRKTLKDYETPIRFYESLGAKDLPWLILSDKDHVVRSDGFPLSELDAILHIGKDANQ